MSLIGVYTTALTTDAAALHANQVGKALSRVGSASSSIEPSCTASPNSVRPSQTLKNAAKSAGHPEVDVERWTCEAHRHVATLWTLADTINDEQYQRLLHEAERELRRFVTATGEVAFAAPAHLVLWQKEPRAMVTGRVRSGRSRKAGAD